MKPEEHQPAPANLHMPYQQQNLTLGGASPFSGDPPKHFFGPPEYPLMIGCDQFHIIQDSCFAASGNDVWSSLRLRELRKLLEAQGAMRVSRAYREVIVSARARCH